jgi:hypothetical protein
LAAAGGHVSGRFPDDLAWVKGYEGARAETCPEHKIYRRGVLFPRTAGA